jgi:hypothetical protein
MRKILLCKFTPMRDIIRWCLDKALGSNSVSGSVEQSPAPSTSDLCSLLVGVKSTIFYTYFSSPVVRPSPWLTLWLLSPAVG